jgi:hypothetical protein
MLRKITSFLNVNAAYAHSNHYHLEDFNPLDIMTSYNVWTCYVCESVLFLISYCNESCHYNIGKYVLYWTTLYIAYPMRSPSFDMQIFSPAYQICFLVSLFFFQHMHRLRLIILFRDSHTEHTPLFCDCCSWSDIPVHQKSTIIHVLLLKIYIKVNVRWNCLFSNMQGQYNTVKR